ncbi:hypothetical protein ACHAQK_004117 [Fusarium lateritium]
MQLGKAGKDKTREISWGNIAAVMTNPHWSRDTILHGNGQLWAKRAQLKFPQADILKGRPNENGPAINDLILTTPRHTRKQQTNASTGLRDSLQPSPTASPSLHDSLQSTPTASPKPDPPDLAKRLAEANLRVALYMAREEELLQRLSSRKQKYKKKLQKLSQQRSLAQVSGDEPMRAKDEVPKNVKYQTNNSNFEKERKRISEQIDHTKSKFMEIKKLAAKSLRLNKATAKNAHTGATLEYIQYLQRDISARNDTCRLLFSATDSN